MNSTDTGMYYIVDVSGNYYQADGENQLVVAGSREEADMFSLAEANQRIGSGKKAHFYSVVPVADAYDMKGTDWHEYLNHFCYLTSGIKGYQKELQDALSDIDKQICDILHYIEFYELDAAESVHMVELLKECREQRRDVKDETVRAEYFQKTLGTDSNFVKVKDAMKQINKLETRRYHPRKLPELFKVCPEKTVRQNKLMRAFDDQTCMDVEKGCYELLDGRQYTEEKGARVEYTKQTTIFDGKKNDWLQFAKQQADFYANAEQYIYNLQTGLREIDGEIEQVLGEVETANYNCAQGYKVFKYLKELRLARKDKQKELECLYILTERLDCRWMADNMLACVGEINAVYEEQGKEKEREEVVEVGLAG